MLATFILRLVPASLTQGDVVGHVECVETGAKAVCHDLADLIRVLRELGSGAGVRDVDTDQKDRP